MENRIIELLKDKIRYKFCLLRLAEKRGDSDMASDYVTQIETLLDVYEDVKEFDFGLKMAFSTDTYKYELRKVVYAW